MQLLSFGRECQIELWVHQLQPSVIPLHLTSKCLGYCQRLNARLNTRIKRAYLHTQIEYHNRTHERNRFALCFQAMFSLQLSNKKEARSMWPLTPSFLFSLNIKPSTRIADEPEHVKPQRPRSEISDRRHDPSRQSPIPNPYFQFSRSTIPAAPIPPPIHMVISPNCLSWRASS